MPDRARKPMPRLLFALLLVVGMALAPLLPPGASAGAPVWQQQAAGAVAESIRAVAYGNGQYVAVTERNVLLTSPNGTDWAFQTYPDPSLKFHDIAYGSGQFVAVGSNGAILTSGNGTGWSWQSVDTGEDLYTVAYCGKQFVATGIQGGIFTSADGRDWTRREPPAYFSLYGLACGSRIVAMGTGLLVSDDGVTWKNVPNPGDKTLVLSRVAYGKDGFVLAGLSGLTTSVLFFSRTGVDWKPVNFSLEGKITALAYVSGQYMAMTVGRDRGVRFYTSPDGTTWGPGDLGALQNWRVNTGTRTNAIFDIAAGAPGLVAVGDTGGIFYTAAATWPPQPAPAAQDGARAMAFSGSRFVALSGQTRILTSPDLITWNAYQWRPASPDPSLTLRDVAYGNHRFMIVGDKGTVLISTDNGATWTPGYSRTATNLSAVVFGAGQFVVAGADGTVRTTSDGITWTERPPVTAATTGPVLPATAAPQVASLALVNTADGADGVLKSGTAYRFEARGLDSSGWDLGTVRPVWSIVYPGDDPSSGRAPVATVDAGGLFTAWGSGPVTVRATWGGLQTDTVVQVASDETVEAGRLFPDNLDRRWDSFAIELPGGAHQGDLKVGVSYQLRAYPVRGGRIIYDTPLRPYWLISYTGAGQNAPNASLDADGNLTVYEPGTFHVGATFGNGGMYMMVTVHP